MEKRKRHIFLLGIIAAVLLTVSVSNIFQLVDAGIIALAAMSVLTLLGAALFSRQGDLLLEKITESEKKYRCLFDRSPDSVLLVDADTGTVIEFNERAYADLGYTRDEFAELAISDFNVNVKAGCCRDYVRQVFSQGVSVYETQMRAKDGSLRHVVIHAVPIVLDGKNYILGNGRDITEEKRIQAELKASEEKFARAFRCSPDSIAISRLDNGVFIDVNSGFEKVTGYSRSEVIGKSALELGLWNDPQDRHEMTQKLRTQGVSDSVEFELRHKSGDLHLCQISAEVIEVGGVACLLAIARDITEKRKQEQALAKSEAFLKATGRMAKVGGWELEAKSMALRWTSETYHIHELPTGYNPSVEEAIKFFHEDDRTVIEKAVGQALKDGKSFDLKLRFKTSTGKQLWVRIICTPEVIEGKTVKLIGAFQDITDRKHVEQAIHAIVAKSSDKLGEQFFKSMVLELARVIGADYTVIGQLVETEDPKITTLAMAVDGAIVDNVTYSLKGTPCEAVLESGSGPCAYPSLVADLFPDDVMLRDDRIQGYCGIPLRDSRGQTLGVLSALFKRPISSENRAMEVLVLFASRVAAEIERMKVETKVSESEERYRSLAETSPSGIIVHSYGKVVFANAEAARLMGASSTGDLIGMDAIDFVHPDARDIVRRRIQHVYTARENAPAIEERFVRLDGTLMDVEAIGVYFDYQGEPAAQVVFRDITDRKRLEAEMVKLEKLESLGVLAGGIAHDFNNILTGIAGNISLAEDQIDPSSEAAELLLHADNAVDRAKDLTQQLLTFSKGGSPVRRTISIGKAITEATKFSLHGSNVRCDVQLSDNLASVHADKGQISQVVNNLIINADQAMPDGGTITLAADNVTIAASTPLPLTPGEYVQITVQDKGIGISAEHIGKIFDPFFTTKESGSGLGLASSYSIIQKHSGHITFESKLGEGAKFIIYLPAS
ncbi:MAG: PAS domain S-box protein, partial [Candidatus Zixiibacteriota bacterium]